ncbi:hypothetical protein O6H91_05G032800 [Diphasiastrum complanatum]|uniref:Uncharacterized protein n=1 Tax=Diphasiastrum complanatum TaxID=34168 RepID=A0ACC2DMM1_DIPCM|nr:hypothetical protein O6H91_05G032800 [Diphasiastrum complanatum]
MGAISAQPLPNSVCLETPQLSSKSAPRSECPSSRQRQLSSSDNYAYRGQSHSIPSYRHPLQPPKASVPVRHFTGEGKNLEELWQQFFADPSQWWDYRFDKTNVSHPDFKHKHTKEALWIDKRSNPDWVQAELTTLEVGVVQQSTFSWNTAIKQHVRIGHDEKAIHILKQMQEEGLVPDNFTFLWILRACASSGTLEEGRHVHSMVSQQGWESDVFVGSSLVDMYAKCGSIEDAYEAFNKIAIHNSVSWTSLITGYVKCGQAKKGLELYRQMHLEMVKPDSVTYGAVLNACANCLALEDGRLVHAQIIESRCKLDDFVGSCLLDMYVKCGSIEEAWNAFNSMHTRNVVCWTTMIAGYVKCGFGEKALELYHKMQWQCINPDTVTFLAALHACASIAALEEGRCIHSKIIESGRESHSLIENCLVDMYIKCGSIHEAWKVFRNIRKHNVACWTTMIIGYVKHGLGEKALELYKQMLVEQIQPDSGTFLYVLHACASAAALEEGRHIHAHIIHSGCELDTSIEACIVDMYIKCGSMEEASEVFNKIVQPDVVCWTAMILGFVRCGQGQKALQLYRQMLLERVEPDSVTFVAVLTACASISALQEGRRIHVQIIQSGCIMNDFVGSCLVEMYVKCGSIEDAGRVFNNLGSRNVVCWTVMIMGFAKCGFGDTAVQLYHQMQMEKVEPDAVTFVAILNACACISALEEGRCIHAQMLRSGTEHDNFVLGCLIDMYAKSGSIADACRVFNNMKSRDEVAYNAMIGAFSMHGQGKEATRLFEQMCQECLKVNNITFVSVLTACSHACLVAEGLYYFESMNAVYDISATMEHYACFVDLLGRAGQLNEAEIMIERMPYVSIPVWRTLLGACRIYGNVKMGERIAEQLLDMEPENASGYVLLSNIYAAAAGQWDRRDTAQRSSLERQDIMSKQMKNAQCLRTIPCTDDV